MCLGVCGVGGGGGGGLKKVQAKYSDLGGISGFCLKNLCQILQLEEQWSEDIPISFLLLNA